MRKPSVRRYLVWLLAVYVCVWPWTSVKGAVGSVTPGPGVVEIPVRIAGERQSMRIYYFKPHRYHADRPVVFVMHGVKRNARDYLNAWKELAQLHNLLVVVPEFSKKQFPGSRSYNLGNVFARGGALNSASEWSFTIIDQLFAKFADLFGSACSRYSIFGHSAGAQYVHRMILLSPQSPFDMAIAANAGWYTLPDLNQAWPYGLHGTSLNEDAVLTPFARKLVVLLGEKDNDPHGKYLNRSREAMAQGPHRLARGQNFDAEAKRAAKRLGVSYSWERRTIKSVGHDHRRMAKFAAKIFAPQIGCR